MLQKSIVYWLRAMGQTQLFPSHIRLNKPKFTLDHQDQ